MASANVPSSSSAKGSAWGAASSAAAPNRFALFGGVGEILADKRPAPDGEEDQEVEQDPEPYWKVMTELPQELRYEGDGEGGYPQYIEADIQKKFPLTVIHSGSDGNLGAYRQLDVPKHTTGGYENGKPKGKKYSEARWPVKAFVLHDVFNASRASAGYCQQDWDTNQFAIDPKDYMLEFKASTQRPMIRLQIVFKREKIIQDNKTVWKATDSVFWECSATCLEKSATNVGVAFQHVNKQNMGFMCDQEQNDDPIFEANLKAGNLLAVDVKLDRNSGDRPRFTGISEEEVKGFSDQIKSGVIPANPREKMLGYLYDATSLRFVTKDPSQEQKYLEAFAKYFRTISYVVAHEGMHWFYKLAAHAVSLRLPSYPFREVGPPRWMITHWLVEIVEKDGKTIYLSAEPRAWKTFPKVDAPVYPNADAFAFELRLATAREDAVAEGAIESLLKGDDPILASFTRSPANPREFLVEMSLKGNSQDSAVLAKVPLYTRIRLEATMGGKRCTFVGKTCDDLRSSGADLVATATLITTHVQDVNWNEKYLVTVTFPVDHKSANRVMNSITALQNGHDRTEGVDLRELALAAPRNPKQQPNWLSDYFGANNDAEERFNAEVNRHKNLNDDQLEAAFKCIDPTNGACMIWGPPGTGKTLTLVVITKALICAGFKVVCTSTSNPAVGNMMEVFEADPPKNLPNGVEWSESYAVRFASTLKHTDTKDTADEDSLDVDQVNEESQYSDQVDKERLAGLFEMLVSQAMSGTAGDKPDRGLAKRKAAWITTISESAPSRETFGLGPEILTFEEQQAQKQKPGEDSLLPSKIFKGKDQLRLVFDNNGDSPMGDADQDQSTLGTQTYSSAATTELSETEKAFAEAEAAEQKRAAADLERRIYAFREAERRHRDAKSYLNLVNQLQSGKLSSAKRKAISKEFRVLESIFNDYYLKKVARVVFVTNNSSQDDALASFKPDVMVSDECGQANPGDSISSWARFREDIKYVVMGGDHKQLSPVVLSGEHSEAHQILERSIFATNVDHPELGWVTVMLKIQ